MNAPVEDTKLATIKHINRWIHSLLCMNRKALIVAYNDLNNSGVPNVIYRVIKALHDAYDFDVLVFDNNDYYYNVLFNEGIKINIIKCSDKEPKTKIFRSFWWFFKRPREHYLYMKRLLKKNKYNVIHSFKEYYSWPFFKAAKKAGINKRIFHSNVDLHRGGFSKYRLLNNINLKLSIKYSTDLIGVSYACCKSAFRNNDFFVIHNCYDEERYNIMEQNKVFGKKLILSHIGSYNANKNQMFSLKILKEIKKIYDDVELILIGSEKFSKYHQSLLDYIRDNDLEKNVLFVKKSDSIEEYYKNSTFVIIPSFSEGFSLVAIEAQACGVYVFASSGVPKDVDAGGIKFINLNKGASCWAEEIFNTFLGVGNMRKKYDLSPFSFGRFKKDLERIYKTEESNI